MSRRPRREFTEEFKLQMVKLYNSEKSASEIVKEYDLDEATADWHIEQAQQWAVWARKALNCANGEK